MHTAPLFFSCGLRIVAAHQRRHNAQKKWTYVSCPHRTFITLLFTLNPGFTLGSLTRSSVFDPSAFHQYFQVATCPGVNRAEDTTVDLQLRRTLLFLHGWPSLWASWKYQIQEFGSDYRLIVPDIRGFGASTHPGDVQSSGSFPDLVGDVTCILGHARVSQAVVIGHDWGTQLAYEAARERPDVFTACRWHHDSIHACSGPICAHICARERFSASRISGLLCGADIGRHSRTQHRYSSHTARDAAHGCKSAPSRFSAERQLVYGCVGECFHHPTNTVLQSR
ncbi:Alpha/Beta hydrolase protein [Russula earlei]|uniref:Alpha/Beta hydrolase protein n=1 Tax=Russula earlei TaxID=71964 RepID=A0ACC0UMF3_9AGAM|nr:Alpha/Beta hydrolase protein [Russula earlei]